MRVSSSKMTTGWAAQPHAAQQGALSAFTDIYSRRRAGQVGRGCIEGGEDVLRGGRKEVR